MVDRRVPHVPLNARGANEVGELGEQGVDRGTGINYLDACIPGAGSLSGCRQRCDVVQQPVVPTVHQEAEMREEVGSYERFRDVGYHEAPRELPA
jgi:hypothetical protein